MATTVFPVPAPPRTRAGPEKFFSTSLRCEGCRNTRHFSSGAFIIAFSSSSPSTIVNCIWVMGFASAAAMLSCSPFLLSPYRIATTSSMSHPSRTQIQRFKCIPGQFGLQGIKCRFRIHRPNKGVLFFRNAKRLQLMVFHSCKKRNCFRIWSGIVLSRCGFIELNAARCMVQYAALSARPIICLVMVIHPQE